MFKGGALPRNLLHVLRNGVKTAFSRHLFLTNISISFMLSGAGDILQQHYRIKCKEQQSWDKLRTKNMTCSGITVGVLCHHWYQILDRKLPGRTMNIVLKKLVVDQLFFSPICIGVFIVTLKLLQESSNAINNLKSNSESNLLKICQNLCQRGFLDLKEEVQDKGLRLYVAEWVIWPPAQLINFYYLPTKYRVFYDNTISLLYDVYASHVCYTSESKDTKNILNDQTS